MYIRMWHLEYPTGAKQRPVKAVALPESIFAVTGASLTKERHKTYVKSGFR